MSINSRLKYSSYTEIIQNPTPIFAWRGIFVWVYLTVTEIMLINPTDIKFQLGRGLFIILFILAEGVIFIQLLLKRGLIHQTKPNMTSFPFGIIFQFQ